MLICQSIWPAKISRSESRAQKPDISKINFQGVHVVEDVAINSELQQRVFTSPNFANKSDRLTIDVGKKVLCKHGFPAKYDLAKFLLCSFTCCVLAFEQANVYKRTTIVVGDDAERCKSPANLQPT